MVMRLMNSKERPYNLNELVGEAAFDVLLTAQPVTTASIILALRARMLTEQNRTVKDVSPIRVQLTLLLLTQKQPVFSDRGGRRALPVHLRNSFPLYGQVNTSTDFADPAGQT